MQILTPWASSAPPPRLPGGPRNPSTEGIEMDSAKRRKHQMEQKLMEKAVQQLEEAEWVAPESGEGGTG